MLSRRLMPTVPRQDGLRCYFSSSDAGEPPHVHVDRAGASAKVWPHTVVVAHTFGFAHARWAVCYC